MGPAMSDGRFGGQFRVSNPTAYRQAMEGFTREAAEMIAGVLSEADFKSDFPHLFGHPDDLGEAVGIRNQCGLWLRKAQLHTHAVLLANQSNNLHSMAVQSRVLLECAAPVLSMANAAAKGSAREIKRIMNAFEYETITALRAMARDSLDPDTLQALVVDARKSVGDLRTRPPKRVTIADRLESITTGYEWYEFLSERFHHSDADTLMGWSRAGGVRRPEGDTDEFSFGFFLDYLAGLLFLMIGGYGLLLNGTKRDGVFDDAIARLKRKRMAAREFMKNTSGDGL